MVASVGKRLALAVLLLAAGEGASASADVHPWAGLGSLVIPGVGQAAQGRYQTALGHGGLWLGTGLASGALAGREDYLEAGTRADEDRRVLFYNRTTYYSELLGTVATDTALFSAYDAFYGGQAQGAGKLVAAPFRPRYLKRMTTWIPVAVRGALVLTDTELDWRITTDDSISKWEIGAANGVKYESVAVGEEALFRGVANRQLTEWWGTVPGVAASSVLFGLAHSGRGGTAGKAAAGGFGAYLGWLHVRNDYDLGEGVAVHFWWNFLTAVDYLTEAKDPEQTSYPLLQLQGRF